MDGRGAEERGDKRVRRLLALSVSVGLGVLSEMMAEEIEDVCGPKGKHNPDRTAYRHGTDDGTVTLGGRRVEVERPRMRSKDGKSEVPVRTWRALCRP